MASGKWGGGSKNNDFFYGPIHTWEIFYVHSISYALSVIDLRSFTLDLELIFFSIQIFKNQNITEKSQNFIQKGASHSAQNIWFHGKTFWLLILFIKLGEMTENCKIPRTHQLDLPTCYRRSLIR